MANFCGNNGYSFPAPSVSSPIFPQFNGTNNMATTMHQHLVHFAPPSIRDNTALQAGTSDPVYSGAKWQEADSSSGVPWSSPSSNGGNVTPTTVWQHTVPSTMPWITPPSVHNTENMYTFNGLSSPPLPSGSPRKKLNRPPPACQRRCKRKCETSMEFGQEQPKEKIFVNEERMAARLEQLQIDNNNLDWHPNLEQETWYSQQRARPKSLQDLDERLSAVVEEDEGESSSSCESDSDNLPRLEMSELLKVGMKTKEILPKLIIDEMNKSAMQVVLWKPPERFISDVVKDISSDHLDKMDMADIEVTNPSGQPKVAEAVKPPQTIRRSGVSTPIPDLLIEAAQMVNNNNTASSSSSQDPDVWHLMTSTPLPDTDLDFTFDDDDMDL